MVECFEAGTANQVGRVVGQADRDLAQFGRRISARLRGKGVEELSLQRILQPTSVFADQSRDAKVVVLNRSWGRVFALLEMPDAHCAKFHRGIDQIRLRVAKRSPGLAAQRRTRSALQRVAGGSGSVLVQHARVGKVLSGSIGICRSVLIHIGIDTDSFRRGDCLAEYMHS